MLEIHERAAHLPTEPPLTWLSFVGARFLGERRERGRRGTVALTLQSAAQRSETAAEVRGLLELSSDGALPVVFECSGTLDLATRELALEDTKAVSYAGSFSENGRVVSLHQRDASGARAKPFHLIEAATLSELL